MRVAHQRVAAFHAAEGATRLRTPRGTRLPCPTAIHIADLTASPEAIPALSRPCRAATGVRRGTQN